MVLFFTRFWGAMMHRLKQSIYAALAICHRRPKPNAEVEGNACQLMTASIVEPHSEIVRTLE